MLSELQAIMGPEVLPMLLVNGATALFAISLIIVVLFRDTEPSRATQRVVLRA